MNDDFERFKIILDYLKFEATTLWQIFNAFFIGHAIVISFVANSLAKKEGEDFIFFLIAGVVGLILALLWLETFRRNSAYFYYRMEQAKKAEKKITENNDWFLFTKEAEIFS